MALKAAAADWEAKVASHQLLGSEELLRSVVPGPAAADKEEPANPAPDKAAAAKPGPDKPEAAKPAQPVLPLLAAVAAERLALRRTAWRSCPAAS